MVLEQPYLPILSFSTKAGVTKVASGFAPDDMQFNLLEAKIGVTNDGNAALAKFVVEDSDATNYSFFTPGASFSLGIGKRDGPYKTILKGSLEMRDVIRPTKNQMWYELTCYDKSLLLNNRVVNISRSQARDLSGNLDPSDTTMDVANLVKYAMGYQPDGTTVIKDAYYPMTNLSNVQALGPANMISVSGVVTTSIILPTYNADFRKVGDVVKELAENVGYVYWIDENDVLQFKSPEAEHSGILVTDDVAGIDISTGAIWNPAKLAHMIDDNPLTVTQTLEDTKNFLIGIGGNDETPDYSQMNVGSGPDSLYNQYIAFKLPPLLDKKLSTIAVYVDKIGNPGVDLVGEVREDNNGTPNGAFVKDFRVGAGSINSTPGWAIADLQADINTLASHWLILYKTTGGTVSDAYRWYHDGSTGGMVATSADGVTWNPAGAGPNYGYLIWADQQIVSIVQDATSINQYGQRDEIIPVKEVKTVDQMTTILNSRIKYLKNMKEIVTVTCYPSDNVIPIGKMVTIQDSLTGINGLYKVVKIEYTMQDIGALNMDITASKVY